jgi:Type II CAAX prenyl endopeptidase Rce1-like
VDTALLLFLFLTTLASMVWGRANRIGYSGLITSVVRFIMKYSKMNAEAIRSYVVWCLYLLVGLLAAVTLLLTYQVNLLDYVALDPSYVAVIPLTFIAQNSLTGLLIGSLLVATPNLNLFSELISIRWISYTMLLPAGMRVLSPLLAAVLEEVFFRGGVFLVLLNRFPETGPYFAILVCTALFDLQQVLQTDTLGQSLILLIGSTSISIVGCIAMLYTGSFLPALVCHPAYAFFYLQLGSSLPRSSPKSHKKGIW